MTRKYVRKKPRPTHAELLEIALTTRFWTQVDRRGPYECWLWTGMLATERKPGAGRYGALTVQGRQYRVHRLSWQLAHGAIPAGQVVRHNCDVTACVNPAHLQLGTQHDNIADMIGRKRHTIGERNRHAKLTADDVMAIRRSDESDNALAKRYGVWATTINAARVGIKWKHLPGARTDLYFPRARGPLTPEEREEIRARRRAGESLGSVAAAFRITKGAACKVAGRVSNRGRWPNAAG